MANIKSAKKRIKIIAKKTLRNKMIKSTLKSAVKKVVLAASAGNKEEASSALVHAVSVLDKAYSKGIYHKNSVARKKSHLVKLVNQLQ